MSVLLDSIYMESFKVAIHAFVAKSELRQSIYQSLERQLQVLFDDLSAGVFANARELHLHQMVELRPYLSEIRSHKTCFCLFQTPEKVFSCGHAICDTCVRCLGERCKEEKHIFRFMKCPFCGIKNERSPIGLIPPTAGIRVLSLDGGGMRGIIELIFLHRIEEVLEEIQIPVLDNFDFACGTSAGK